MSDSKFYIYSMKGCSFCDKLVDFMDSKEIAYEKFTLEEDYSRMDFILKFGHHSTFPQVIHENRKIGGMKDSLRYLVENKYV